MSKQLLAALCLAAVMVAALPGTNAWRPHPTPPHKPYYTKHNSKKVSGYNKNLGANLGKMTNIDLNKNSAGSHQSGHITGVNFGLNAQDNWQTVDASPHIIQDNYISNNPHVYSGNDNKNYKHDTVRVHSPNVHISKKYKKCPYHGHCE